MSLDTEILDEILLPEIRGGKGVARAIEYQVVRALDLDDLDALMNGGALTPANQGKNLTSIRSAHHLLAQLCAEGKSNIEIGLITGHSPNYVSRLRNYDPAFRELLTHYTEVREKVFVDVLERMKSLGVASLEELQARIEADPSKFPNGQLLAIAESMLGKGGGMQHGGGQGAPSVSINVNFVPSGQDGAVGRTIELEPNK